METLAKTVQETCNPFERKELRHAHDCSQDAAPPCAVTGEARVFRCHVSYAEEADLSPALMVYLRGCNLRCRFCLQALRLAGPDVGMPLHSREVVARIETLSRGVKWLNWVGGEPSLHAAAIRDLRERLRTPARWLLNTNGIFPAETLALLDPVMDLYVVDLKFGSETCARRLAGASRYLPTVQRNLSTIHATGSHRLLVRHLLLPGHETCCFEPVARWVAANLPGVRFHLMDSYVPGPLVMDDPVLGRTVPVEAVAGARQRCRQLGLNMTE